MYIHYIIIQYLYHFVRYYCSSYLLLYDAPWIIKYNINKIMYECFENAKFSKNMRVLNFNFLYVFILYSDLVTCTVMVY